MFTIVAERRKVSEVDAKRVQDADDDARPRKDEGNPVAGATVRSYYSA